MAAVAAPAAGTPGLDRLSLVGLRAFGHHGVLESERQDGQEFVVDVDLWVDVRAAASHDDLNRTVDYSDLGARLTAAVAHDPVDLIETVAERLARLCLTYDAVRAVDVTLHKPNAPLQVPFGDVRLTIHRSRDD